jgi:hypothetical protein
MASVEVEIRLLSIKSDKIDMYLYNLRTFMTSVEVEIRLVSIKYDKLTSTIYNLRVLSQNIYEQLNLGCCPQSIQCCNVR